MRPAERQRVPTTKKSLAPEVLATFASHGRDHRLTAGGFFPAPVIGKLFVIPGIHYFDAHRLRPAASSFFSSSMADVALWLGPYMSISSKNAICTRTEKARKCRQITTNQPSHRPARRPANPPARLAFRQKKQQTRHAKRGKSPNKNTHKKICHRTQWSDHCITLKNMHTMN